MTRNDQVGVIILIASCPDGLYIMVQFKTRKAEDQLSSTILEYMRSVPVVFGIGQSATSKVYVAVPCSIVQNGVIRIFGDGDSNQEQYESLTSMLYADKVATKNSEATISPDLAKLIKIE
jgi:hypothetical protein